MHNSFLVNKTQKQEHNLLLIHISSQPAWVSQVFV